jgi:hypothetical protein
LPWEGSGVIINVTDALFEVWKVRELWKFFSIQMWRI